MSQEAFSRIDKGIKRKQDPLDLEARKKIRQEARQQPLNKKVKVWTVYDPQKRAELIQRLPEAILNNITTTQFAEQNGVAPSTLRSWVLGDSETEKARGAMLASELMLRINEIEDSQDALALARAREGFRAWSWIAERRENRLWGQRNHLTVEDQPLSDVDRKLLGDAGEMLALFKAKAAEIEARKEKVINSSDSEAKERVLMSDSLKVVP